MLKAALKKLGYVHVTLSDGSIQVETTDGNIRIFKDRAQLEKKATKHLNKIRQAYSDESVYARAEQLGFSVVEEEITEEEARGNG